MKVLLEVRIGERWRPIRIDHDYASVRAAFDSLPMFAWEQSTSVDNVRMKVLRTEPQLLAAENMIAHHNSSMTVEQVVMRTDRQELEGLRVSLGRVAQVVGVQTDDKPVLDKPSYNELCEMAKEDRGWNALAALICEEIGWTKRELERYQKQCE